MEKTNHTCYIDGKPYSLSDVEKMGLKNFQFSAHIHPYHSIFRYYPNTKKYVKEEKKYRNFSLEALKNNTIYLQDAKNFDDCFDCAVDLEWDKFLFERVKTYCTYFKANSASDNIGDMVYALALKLFEFDTAEKCIEYIPAIEDKVQKLHFEVFIRDVFNKGLNQKEYRMHAIFSSIQKEYEEFKNCLSKFRITCFSTSAFLNRMWSSAYADNNRGFCIEYEVNTSTETGNKLYENFYPVIYSEKRGDLFMLSKNDDKTPTEEDIWQMYFNGLLRKDIIWKDQQEWRLILYGNLIKENPMPFYKIKKVYLGNRMPLKERKKIAAYCRKNNIEYVGLERQPNSYNLVECKGDCYVCAKNKNIKPME